MTEDWRRSSLSGVRPQLWRVCRWLHIGVGTGAAAVEATGLHPAGSGDLLANVGAGRARRFALQLAIRNGRDFNVDVDAIK